MSFQGACLATDRLCAIYHWQQDYSVSLMINTRLRVAVVFAWALSCVNYRTIMKAYLVLIMQRLFQDVFTLQYTNESLPSRKHLTT